MVSDYRAAELHGLAENGVRLADRERPLSIFRLNEYALELANIEAVA
jgi:hypothetical protein